MLRFAELEPHIVIAQASRNSTAPFQLTITVEVVKDLRQVEYIETNSDGTAVVRQSQESQGAVPLLVVVILGAVLVLAIAALIYFIIKSKKGTNQMRRYKTASKTPSRLNCCFSCRKPKLTPF